jgi:hypothetical protein
MIKLVMSHGPQESVDGLPMIFRLVISIVLILLILFIDRASSVTRP